MNGQKEGEIVVNEDLRALYERHLPNLLDLRTRHRTSYPLLIQASHAYQAAPRKVVFVGQQTYGWAPGDDEAAEMEADLPARMIDGLLKLYTDFFPSHLSSPFWRAVRQLESLLIPGPVGACAWTNLVKVDHDGRRPAEPADQDWFGRFNVVAEEMRILKPDVVIFFTGPYYDDRLVETFPGAKLEPVWESDGTIFRVEHPDLPAHTYRTYHPGYLSRTNWHVLDQLVTLCQEGSDPLQIRASEALLVQNRARRSLADTLREQVGAAAMDPRHEGYAAKLQENLLSGITEAHYLPEFTKGAGHELDQKMRAAYSSSALTVSTFARWKGQTGALSLGSQRGFERIQFEAACPTGLQGAAPHLDLLAEGAEGLVGVEVKCTEYLQAHEKDLPDAYDDLLAKYPALERVASEWGFTFLNASQLIKHALGLLNEARERPATLLYLFWEPVNWDDYRIFAEHRREVRHFAELLQNGPIRFEAMTCDQLWTAWELRPGPDWVPVHVEALRGRYSVSI